MAFEQKGTRRVVFCEVLMDKMLLNFEISFALPTIILLVHGILSIVDLFFLVKWWSCFVGTSLNYITLI